MQEAQGTKVPSLGWEDPLEEGRATPCSLLAWRIPRIEAPGGLQSTGSQSRTRLSALERAHPCKGHAYTHSERQFLASSKVLNLTPIYLKKKYYFTVQRKWRLLSDISPLHHYKVNNNNVKQIIK